MKIRTKEFTIDAKRVEVEVANINCYKFLCFSPHRFVHQQRSISGESMNYQDKNYSCSHRNYHGCPDNPKLKDKFKPGQCEIKNQI